MKIVILDGYIKNPGDLSWSRYEELGALTIYDRTPANDTKLKMCIRDRIGSGPIVIGQAAEFDYAGTQACRALKEEGRCV